jgi:hypothetical protein
VRAHRTLFVLTLAAITIAACKKSGPSGGTSSGGGGEGGAGGACPTAPQAMFELTIKAEDGPLPSSTSVDVSWSAGDEPTFELDQPSTWKTIEQANLVCDVDAAKPPPTDLAALVCHLWTAGPINLVVKAKGYTTFEKTYVPVHSDHCDALVPSAISVEIAPAPQGAGGGN